jgi:hypothetical protein
VRWGGNDIVATGINGVPTVDVTAIHGTALTETATQLAGAFTKFFNVATPTGTVNSLPDAVAGANTGLQICGSNAAATYATLSVTGQFDAGNVLVDANTVLTGTLGVGATTLASLTSTGAITAESIVNNGVFTQTGNVAHAGTTTLASLSITGQTDTGNLLIDSTVAVGTTTTLTGNVSLGGTLGVTGITTLAALSVTGQLDAGNVLVDTTTALTGAVSAPAGIAANLTGNITGTLATVTTLTNAPADMALNSTVGKEATLTTIAGYIDTEIGTIITAVGTTIPNAIAALPTDADVNAACDTAVSDAGIPAATAALVLVTPAQKIVTNASGEVDANVQSVNDTALTGNGSALTPWGPV